MLCFVGDGMALIAEWTSLELQSYKKQLSCQSDRGGFTCEQDKGCNQRPNPTLFIEKLNCLNKGGPKMRILLSIMMVLALAAGLALAADVTGAWKASIPGRDGATQVTTFNLKADGNTLTGNVATERGETAISEGKISGDTISFKVKREFNGNAMIMTYEGTVSGDEIKFKTTREGSDRPPREFVAKKS
jgi:hypothetical protein